jgi:hypothetical protein
MSLWATVPPPTELPPVLPPTGSRPTGPGWRGMPRATMPPSRAAMRLWRLLKRSPRQQARPSCRGSSNSRSSRRCSTTAGAEAAGGAAATGGAACPPLLGSARSAGWPHHPPQPALRHLHSPVLLRLFLPPVLGWSQALARPLGLLQGLLLQGLLLRGLLLRGLLLPPGLRRPRRPALLRPPLLPLARCGGASDTVHVRHVAGSWGQTAGPSRCPTQRPLIVRVTRTSCVCAQAFALDR